MMTVKEVREKLSEFSDDDEVMIDAGDAVYEVMSVVDDIGRGPKETACTLTTGAEVPTP